MYFKVHSFLCLVSLCDATACPISEVTAQKKADGKLWFILYTFSPTILPYNHLYFYE